MGPNFRDLHSLNYSRCKKEIGRAIEEFDANFRLKYRVEDIVLDLWVNKVKKSQN